MVIMQTCIYVYEIYITPYSYGIYIKKNTNKQKKEEKIKLFNTLKSIGIVKKHISIHTYIQIDALYKYTNIT